MTDPQAITWDMTEQSLVSTLADVGVLLAGLPDDMHHSASRNRLTMAQQSIEQAQDQVSAARHRLPK
jgi:hypothetical protein